MKICSFGLMHSASTGFVKRAAIVALTLTAVVTPQVLPAVLIQPAQASASMQQNWLGQLKIARLTTSDQLVLQLDIQDKPLTTYANAVYQIHARRGNEWVTVYTSQGARLLQNIAGRSVLESEVVDCESIKRQLQVSDLSNVELKAVAMLRYDAQGSLRDQRVQYEQVQQFQSIAQTQTTQLIAYQQQTVQQTVTQSNYQEKRGFNLSILQSVQSDRQVIARLSLKSRRDKGYESEQHLGDYRYSLNNRSKAKFVKGIRAGDRVVVRLFSPQNQFIGYSEFEMLSEHTTVSLVLDRNLNSGVVRTIYGSDRNGDFSLDRNTTVYDYFTAVSRTSRYSQSNVTFFQQTRNLDLRTFEVAGFPRPQSNCIHPSSFRSGSSRLVNRTFSAFSSQLSRTLIALPGQIAQTINIAYNSSTTYQISQQIRIHEGTLIVRNDDDNRKGKKRKVKCNNGRGNGSEGCHPGNSRSDDDDDDDDDDDRKSNRSSNDDDDDDDD